MTGDIKIVGGDANTNIAFKNCQSLIRSVIHLSDKYIDTADDLDLTMGCLYSFIQYSDN